MEAMAAIDPKEIVKKLVAFRDARDWKQFHNPKDMALYLTLEAAEVLEHFAWKNGKEMEEFWDALEKKMKKNEAKYPVEKARGGGNCYPNHKSVILGV